MANNRVTTKEFYEKMERVEQRLIGRLDSIHETANGNSAILEGIHRDIAAHHRRLDSHADKIDKLQSSDRRWGGINAVLVAIGSTIAAIIGINK